MNLLGVLHWRDYFDEVGPNTAFSLDDWCAYAEILKEEEKLRKMK